MLHHLGVILCNGVQLSQWHLSCLLPDKQLYLVGHCAAAGAASGNQPIVLLSDPNPKNPAGVYIYKVQGEVFLWQVSLALNEQTAIYTMPYVPR